MANTGGYSRLEAKLRAMRDQCAHLRHYQEQLFEDVSHAVATATRKDRQKVFEVLSDYASMMDESDCNVVPSHNSINQLEKEVNAFEDSKGAFKSLADYVESDLFWIIILHVLSLCLLVVGLLMGICTHDRNIEPHERSGLSHLIGCELTLTAYAFTLFVIVGIMKSMFMTIESTLGYTYFCEPYLSKNYVILDDALERLWPASNRSHLLSRIMPSEVMENCQNESISVLDLGPKPSHGRTSHRRGVFLPRLNLKIVLQELSSQPEHERAKDSFSHTADVFINAIPSFQNALSVEAKFLNGNRANATIFLNKRSDFRNKDSDPMINKTVIKKVLLPMIPSYYNRFVTDLVNIAMQPTGNTVAGRCSLLRALLKSFMDVVCYTYVLEFVGYWASLLLAVFLAMLVIPFCFMLAKYFFCTQRLIHVLRRPRKSRKGMAAHSLSESLEREQTPEQYGQVHPLTRLLQMYAGSELPPGTSRRIVAMSTKNTSILPTLGPPIHQMASFSSRVTQTPKRLHAVHSSTSIIATGGGVPVVAGIPVASVGAVVAAQPAAPSMIHGHSVAAPVGHVASSSVHRTNSLTLVQPHYHSRLCTNVASSSHQSLVPPVQAPLMYGAPVPMALPQSQPSFAVKPMPAVCVPVQASVPVQTAIPVQASVPSTRLLTRTTAVSSGSQLNLVAPPAASMMAVARPSTVVYRQAYPATYALPSRVSVAPSLALAPVYAPRRRTVSVHSVSSSSSSGSLRAVRGPGRTVAFARPRRTLSAHSMTTHTHRRL
ncbi:uncharacterized protein [Dermacentor andersoni]|uniref:uncharacterized protein n=1 Tax=Dermacentor andersoni TaxID=34620 RepID=UPI0024170891|nr:uncharacterized protein LOC129380951 [Dermacentor andersoni]